jgi:TldD protein
VLGQRKTVIDNGTLKLVLTTRTPVQGSSQSTGNHRGGGARPSNLIVTSTNGMSDSELKSTLLALVKQRGLEYGVIVRELGGTALSADDPMAFMSMMRGGNLGRKVLLAYRVYPDGREELVRGVRLMDVTAESFKDILAVSTTETIYHHSAIGSDAFPFSMEFMEWEAGPSGTLASYVVPSMLFEDLSLARDTGDRPKPPLSSPPGAPAR